MMYSVKENLAWQVLHALHREVFLVFLLSVAITLLSLTSTIYMLQIYDRIMLSMSLDSLYLISAMILIMYTLHATAEMLRSKLLIVMSRKIEATYDEVLFNTGIQAYLLNRSMNPAESLKDFVEFKQFFSGSSLSVFFDFLLSPIFIVIAYWLHPLLGHACVCVLLVQAGILYLNHRAQNRLTAIKEHAQLQPRNYIFANFRNIAPQHVMGMSDYFLNRLVSLYQQQTKIDYLVRQTTSLFGSCLRTFRYIFQIISLAIGAFLVINGEITPGSMIAANIIFTKALTPFDQLIHMWPEWIKFLVVNHRLGRLFGNKPKKLINNSSEAEDLVLHTIALQQVDVQFDSRLSPALKDINMAISAGDIVAIMGKSGSGKSTLAKIITGILTPGSGQVLINQVPSNSSSQSDIHRYIGYLPQDFQLFEGSVADNIARFESLDSSKIVKAAINAGAHEWILRLPHGYQTLIGATGVKLSGGQKQQLGIARAIYGDVQLVVLDEPNSSLDDAGERALHQLLQLLKAQEIITVVISHNDNVLKLSDLVVLLEDGVIKSLIKQAEAVPAIAN